LTPPDCTQIGPFGLALHGTQVPPFEPHASKLVPVTHWSVSGLQQPLAQAVWLASPQLCSQRCVVVLHDSKLVQSAAELQPQPPARHSVPFGDLVQSRQVVPLLGSMQADGVLPGWHMPPNWLEQQPPLQVEFTSQLVEQVAGGNMPNVQARPTAHSLDCAQPQAPPPGAAKQVGPRPLVAQVRQVPPVAPQAAGSVPAAHLPALQQP
jgi:hypothetical protein